MSLQAITQMRKLRDSEFAVISMISIKFHTCLGPRARRFTKQKRHLPIRPPSPRLLSYKLLISVQGHKEKQKATDPRTDCKNPRWHPENIFCPCPKHTKHSALLRVCGEIKQVTQKCSECHAVCLHENKSYVWVPFPNSQFNLSTASLRKGGQLWA